VTARGLGDGAQGHGRPSRVELHDCTLAGHRRGPVRELPCGRVGELAEVRRLRLRLEPLVLDSRGRAEQVEKRGHLVGRRADHLHVPRRRLTDVLEPLERAREPRGRRERRPEIVAGE
jgi:hypothetical protein